MLLPGVDLKPRYKERTGSDPLEHQQELCSAVYSVRNNLQPNALACDRGGCYAVNK